MNRRGFFGLMAAIGLATKPTSASAQGTLTVAKARTMSVAEARAYIRAEHAKHEERYELVLGPSRFGGEHLVVPKEWRDTVADEMKAREGFDSQYVFRMRTYGTSF